MEIVSSCIQHLVKSEDLNHHRTLYAGRTAEWFVEAGFVAAASLVPPEGIVCMKIHGMEFKRPVRVGEIACFEGKIVYAGRTSMIAFIRMHVKGNEVVSGFITFIHVDDNGNPVPHGIEVEPKNPEEQILYDRAQILSKQHAS